VVFSPDAVGAFQRPAYCQKTGTPRLYSDELIEALLTVKVVLRLSLRAVEGFARGMARMAQASWRVVTAEGWGYAYARDERKFYYVAPLSAQAGPASGISPVALGKSASRRKVAPGSNKARDEGLGGYKRKAPFQPSVQAPKSGIPCH